MSKREHEKRASLRGGINKGRLSFFFFFFGGAIFVCNVSQTSLSVIRGKKVYEVAWISFCFVLTRDTLRWGRRNDGNTATLTTPTRSEVRVEPWRCLFLTNFSRDAGGREGGQAEETRAMAGLGGGGGGGLEGI